MKFPKNCHLMLMRNEHSSCYRTVVQSIEWEDHGYMEEDWVNDEEMRKAIETDECWTLQWYPRTPVGFCILSAHSLEVLLEAACRYDD